MRLVVPLILAGFLSACTTTGSRNDEDGEETGRLLAVLVGEGADELHKVLKGGEASGKLRIACEKETKGPGLPPGVVGIIRAPYRRCIIQRPAAHVANSGPKAKLAELSNGGADELQRLLAVEEFQADGADRKVFEGSATIRCSEKPGKKKKPAHRCEIRGRDDEPQGIFLTLDGDPARELAKALKEKAGTSKIAGDMIVQCMRYDEERHGCVVVRDKQNGLVTEIELRGPLARNVYEAFQVQEGYSGARPKIMSGALVLECRKERCSLKAAAATDR